MHSSRERPEKRRLLGFVGKAVFSLVIIAAVLHLSDMGSVVDTLTKISIPALVAAMGITFAQIVLSGLRWFCLCRQTGNFLKPWTTLRIMFLAMFSTQLMPTSIGADVVRAVMATRAGMDWTRATSTVVLDRAAGLLSLLVMMAVTGFVIADLLPDSRPVGLLRGLPFAAIAAVVTLTLTGERLAGVLEGRRGFGAAVRILRDFHRLMTGGWLSLVVLGLSFSLHLLGAACIWVIADGIGWPVSYLQILGFLPVVILAMLIPVSIAGWGVREGMIVLLFSVLHIGAAEAFSVSVLWGGVTVASAVLAGGIWFWTRNEGDRIPLPADADGQAP